MDVVVVVVSCRNDPKRPHFICTRTLEHYLFTRVGSYGNVLLATRIWMKIVSPEWGEGGRGRDETRRRGEGGARRTSLKWIVVGVLTYVGVLNVLSYRTHTTHTHNHTWNWAKTKAHWKQVCQTCFAIYHKGNKDHSTGIVRFDCYYRPVLFGTINARVRAQLRATDNQVARIHKFTNEEIVETHWYIKIRVINVILAWLHTKIKSRCDNNNSDNNNKRDENCLLHSKVI